VRVDAHHHVWTLAHRDQPWIDESMSAIRRDFTIADLAPLAASSEVDKTVLVQTVTVPEETPELLALAARTDLVGGVVGWVDLTAPSAADDIAALLARPGGQWLRAIRHQVQGEPDPWWLCRDDVRRGLRAVFDAGLLYELLVLPHQLPAAIRTVSAFADAPFVLDHCAKPPIALGELGSWAGDIRRLAREPNVVCKLSGLVTEAAWTMWTVDDLREAVDTVLDAFGPDRLAFGSDWPVCLLAAEYHEVIAAAEAVTAQLSPDEREAIFAGTATRVYRL